GGHGGVDAHQQHRGPHGELEHVLARRVSHRLAAGQGSGEQGGEEGLGGIGRGTAQRLFTHRHTVRYRLERVRELSGLDVGSSDGREKLSLGLKAMRVLGISRRGGPATEAGTGAGRVPGRG
ncbi:MAG: helix-turn-helix domain-containing protein, partial [Solirubrobacterales bacterium]